MKKKQNIEFLKKDKSLFRIMHNPYTLSKLEELFPKTYNEWVEYEDSLSPNFPMVYGIFDAYGFTVLRNLQYELLLKKILAQGSDSKLINLLNIKYLISDRLMKGNKWKLVKRGKYSIFENIDVLPRAFFIPDEKKELNISLEKLCGINCRYPVLITEYRNNSVKLQAVAQNNGWVFMSDTYYPGWCCYVDGRKEEIRKVDNLFRTVFIEKGRHDIKFIFKPLSFRIGLAISFITFIICLGYLLICRRNKKEVKTVLTI